MRQDFILHREILVILDKRKVKSGCGGGEPERLSEIGIFGILNRDI